MAGQRARDFWDKVTFPFAALWMLVKILWFAMGVFGLRPRKARLADVVFPVILRQVDGRGCCVVTTADQLRQNPLHAAPTEKLLLIDSAARLYMVSNMRQAYSDLRTLWRLVAPSNKPIAYRFDLRRRRSGLNAAKKAVGNLAIGENLDNAATMQQLINAVAASHR